MLMREETGTGGAVVEACHLWGLGLPGSPHTLGVWLYRACAHHRPQRTVLRT